MFPKAAQIISEILPEQDSVRSQGIRIQYRDLQNHIRHGADDHRPDNAYAYDHENKDDKYKLVVVPEIAGSGLPSKAFYLLPFLLPRFLPVLSAQLHLYAFFFFRHAIILSSQSGRPRFCRQPV